MVYVQHQSMSRDRWYQLALIEQLANIGSEVVRSIHWQTNHYGNPQDAFYRCLELCDLTISDPKNIHRLKEVCIVREALVDWFMGSNEYNTTNKQWEAYFFQFNYAVRLNK